MPARLPADRSGALLGLLGAAGNVAGVAFLWNVPGAYRPDALDRWAEGSAAHPDAAMASAVAFVLGLLALAGWGAAMGRRAATPGARLGGSIVATGAVANAIGCVAPLVLVAHVLPGCRDAACAPVARALLGTTLALDALFNALFGAGLVLTALSLGRAERRPVLAALGVAAGLASLPVSLQVASDAAAGWLAVAAPLWLAFVAATSVLLARRGAHHRHAGTQTGGAHAAVARSS